MNNEKIINTVKVIALALVFGVGIQYAAAQTTWTSPPSSPPGGNTYAPLNVGSSGQVKDGGLTLGHTLTNAGVGLLVPKGRVGFGTTAVNGNTNARITIGQTEISTPGNNALVSFQSNPNSGGSDLYYHIMRLGTDHSLNLDSFSGGSWQTSLSILPNRQIKLPGGSPAAGRVLTATDATGLASWQQPVGVRSASIADGATIPVPAGFNRNQCQTIVSPMVITSNGNQGIASINATADSSGVVTCEYTHEDDGTVRSATCAYMIICSR